jgi:hypothetical protein
MVCWEIACWLESAQHRTATTVAVNLVRLVIADTTVVLAEFGFLPPA